MQIGTDGTLVAPSAGEGSMRPLSRQPVAYWENRESAILSFDLTSEIADVMVMICGSADSRPFCEVISVCIQPECLPEYPFEGKLEYYGKTGARSHYPFGRIVIQA